MNTGADCGSCLATEQSDFYTWWCLRSRPASLHQGSDIVKIEKLNDNQIRCTLEKTDLDQRHLHLSELAYGSPKAKSLFRDLIQRANDEFGFDADDIPLMIEAIPVSQDVLILIVTKVEDPDELDTRFSHFSGIAENILGGEYDVDMDEEDDIYEEDALSDMDDESFDIEGMDSDRDSSPDSVDPLNLLAPFTSALAEAGRKEQKTASSHRKQDIPFSLFLFHNLDDIIGLAASAAPFYQGDSILFHSEEEYLLVLKKVSGDTENTYRRACHIASEYGIHLQTSTYATLDYLKEHHKPMIPEEALNILSELV